MIYPATHLLTDKDIVYRDERASVKAIICDGEDVILDHIKNALPKSPTVEIVISVGPNTRGIP